MQASHRLPKLSRATFCLVARTIEAIDFDTLNDRQRVIAEFTDALRPTNPNFKPERFRTACNPDGGLRTVRHA